MRVRTRDHHAYLSETVAYEHSQPRLGGLGASATISKHPSAIAADTLIFALRSGCTPPKKSRSGIHARTPALRTPRHLRRRVGLAASWAGVAPRQRHAWCRRIVHVPMFMHATVVGPIVKPAFRPAAPLRPLSTPPVSQRSRMDIDRPGDDDRRRGCDANPRMIVWSERRDSNPRPRAWEAPTLPTELRSPGGWGGDCNSLLGEVFGEEPDERAGWALDASGGADRHLLARAPRLADREGAGAGVRIAR